LGGIEVLNANELLEIIKGETKTWFWVKNGIEYPELTI